MTITDDDTLADFAQPAPTPPEPPGPALPASPRLACGRLLEATIGLEDQFDANDVRWSARAGCVVQLVVGFESYNLPRFAVRTAEEAVAPLYSLRAEIIDGSESFAKARRLAGQLAEAQAAADDAASAGSKALAAARQAIASGADPSPHEDAYRDSAGQEGCPQEPRRHPPNAPSGGRRGGSCRVVGRPRTAS
jgi:hypothetical protein